jgi:RNA polymerase subunit RPABC4/transcription elongation factor Spt4
MYQCQNCRKINAELSNFCHFCGSIMTQPQPTGNYSPPPPPYSWKTDEFQVGSQSARQTQKTEIPQPFSSPNPMNPPMPYQQNMQYANNYRCPRCGTQNPPYFTRQVSTAGWMVFLFLLLLGITFIFCWIGLLIKEDVRICPMCGLKVSF